MKTKKYNYYKVIQQYYCAGYGWEDVSFYPCNSIFYCDVQTRLLIRHDIFEYRLTGYATRIIKRREKV